MPTQSVGDAFVEAVGLTKTNIIQGSIDEIKKIINGLTRGVVVALTCESSDCDDDGEEDKPKTKKKSDANKPQKKDSIGDRCLDVTGITISDGESVDFSHFVKAKIKGQNVNYKLKVHFSYTPKILGGSTIHLCPKDCPASSYVRGTTVQVAFVGSMSFNIGLDLKGKLTPKDQTEVDAEAKAADVPAGKTIDAVGTDPGEMDKDTPDEIGISSLLPIDPLPDPKPGPTPPPDPIKVGGGFSGKIKKNYTYDIDRINCP